MKSIPEKCEVIHVQADKWQLQTLQTPPQMEVSNLRVSLPVLQERKKEKILKIAGITVKKDGKIIIKVCWMHSEQ